MKRGREGKKCRSRGKEERNEEDEREREIVYVRRTGSTIEVYKMTKKLAVMGMLVFVDDVAVPPSFWLVRRMYSGNDDET